MSLGILLVEDQEEIRKVVSKYIENEGYKLYVAKDGFEALEKFNEGDISLVVLDVMMPGIDGFEVLEEIRKISDVPVIMLTAKQEEIDKIKGFDLGADDYVSKPFSSRELMRRIKAILKRVYKEDSDIILKYDSLELNESSKKLFKNSKEIEITSIEFNILKMFLKNKGQVLSRDQIINKVYGYNFDGEIRSVDSYIKRIRKKIEDNPKEPKFIVTKYGAGYVFGES